MSDVISHPAPASAPRVGRLASPRLAGLALALPTSGVIAVARYLTPSPTGIETHLQLGLKPCFFLHLTGWPCPMCGMTTTFAWMAHGHPFTAAGTQPFGVVLFSRTLAGAIVGLLDLVTGRGIWASAWRVLAPHERTLAGFLLGGLLLGWAYKCAVMHPEVVSAVVTTFTRGRT